MTRLKVAHGITQTGKIPQKANEPGSDGGPIMGVNKRRRANLKAAHSGEACNQEEKLIYTIGDS